MATVQADVAASFVPKHPHSSDCQITQILDIDYMACRWKLIRSIFLVINLSSGRKIKFIAQHMEMFFIGVLTNTAEGYFAITEKCRWSGEVLFRIRIVLKYENFKMENHW